MQISRRFEIRVEEAGWSQGGMIIIPGREGETHGMFHHGEQKLNDKLIYKWNFEWNLVDESQSIGFHYIIQFGINLGYTLSLISKDPRK